MDRDLHIAGIASTALLHLGLIAAMVMVGNQRTCNGDTGSGPRLDKMHHIEAALEIKGEKPKNRQPQKHRKRKFRRPKAPAIARDPNKKVKQKPKKKTLTPKKDEIDPESVLKKNRKYEDNDTGVNLPKVGSASGSRWGTEADAKGDPYVGELNGRIHKVWEVPTLERQAAVAIGCVKLDKKGHIVERKLVKPSQNATLDRSVQQALKQATDMDKPVPPRLIELLTRQGICFKFSAPSAQ